MLGRHFNGVKAHPGLSWDLESGKIIDRLPENGSNVNSTVLILQEHPDENLSRPGRPCSCQIVAGISRVDPLNRKVPLSMLPILVESCLDYGRESGLGPHEARVVVFQGNSAEAEANEYRLRVLKYGQKENPNEIRVSLHNLPELRERMATGQPLAGLEESQTITSQGSEPVYHPG